MSGILRVVVFGLCFTALPSWAQAPVPEPPGAEGDVPEPPGAEGEVPEPPGAEADVPQPADSNELDEAGEPELGPEQLRPVPVQDAALVRAVEQHRVDVATAEVTGDFQDALREDDRDGALEAAAQGRTPAVACIEVLLREQIVAEVFVPTDAGPDALGIRVLETVVPVIVEAIDPLRIALARCLSTIDDAPRFAEMQAAFSTRAEALEQIRMRVLGPDLIAAHPSMRDAVEYELEVSWDEIRQLYFDSHGTLREAAGEKRTPGWRNAALIVGSIVFSGSLVLVPVSFRGDTGVLDSARVRLGLLGFSIATIGGLFMAGAWVEPTSEKTVGRLIGTTTVTLASIAGGLALAFADVPRRFRYMGYGFVTGAIGNVFWLAGGVALYRRTRPFRHGRPTITITRNEGSLGWTGSF